ncbi:MAG: metallophosphoesterase family protein [Chloroflexi bacterium]|nr:metallophosphoesterase family protein [Chloroflexota bacterium]
MRLALLSDIHGDLVGLQAALACIDQQGGVDAAYALGDMVGGGTDSGRILDLLVARGTQMVRGNWEEFVLDIEASIHRASKPDLARRMVAEARAGLTSNHLALMASLPYDLIVEPEPGRRAYLCHAAPGNPHSPTCRPDVPADTLRKVYGGVDADLVVYGHNHGHHVIPLDGKLLVNVASVGLRDDGLTALTFVDYAGNWTVRQWLVPCKRAISNQQLATSN